MPTWQFEFFKVQDTYSVNYLGENFNLKSNHTGFRFLGVHVFVAEWNQCFWSLITLSPNWTVLCRFGLDDSLRINKSVNYSRDLNDKVTSESNKHLWMRWPKAKVATYYYDCRIEIIIKRPCATKVFFILLMRVLQKASGWFYDFLCGQNSCSILWVHFDMNLHLHVHVLYFRSRE